MGAVGAMAFEECRGMACRMSESHTDGKVRSLTFEMRPPPCPRCFSPTRVERHFDATAWFTTGKVRYDRYICTGCGLWWDLIQ